MKPSTYSFTLDLFKDEFALSRLGLKKKKSDTTLFF